MTDRERYLSKAYTWSRDKGLAEHAEQDMRDDADTPE